MLPALIEGATSFARAHARLFGPAVLLGLVCVVCVVAIAFPLANWDMVAYLATILEKGLSDPAEVHRRAWMLVEEAVSPGRFVVLTQDRPYRVAQYADADAFASMLGFYRVKWLYIETLSLLAQIMPPVAAIRTVSAVSAGLVGAVALVWLWLHDRLEWAALLAAGLVLAGYGEVARLATPDAFASVFFLVGVLAYLCKREALVAAALFAAFLARPDHLAFIGVFMVASLVLRAASFGAIAAFVVSALAYVPIVGGADHPGWWAQFWFTDVEYLATMRGFAEPFAPDVYLFALFKSVARSLVEANWLALVLGAMIGWMAMARYGLLSDRRERVVLAALFLTIAAKFVLLPLHEDRFNFAYLAAMALVFVCALPRLRAETLSPD